MKHPWKPLLVLVLLCLFAAAGFQTVHGQEAVVRAVLFYSPTCPHCETVINEVLPPLVDQYGTRLQIFGVNTHTERGSQLFQAAIKKYDIPEDQQAVPTLIVGDHVLVGSREIPERFPSIIEEGMASGGMDWPPIPGLVEEMERMNAESESSQDGHQQDVAGVDQELTLREKFANDLAGNSLATLLLAGMLFSLARIGSRMRSQANVVKDSPPSWLIPVLTLLGLVVAAYLSYIELTNTAAVCGPVGHCNVVQQSPYAYLFGLLPVGLIGVAGYVLILGTWLLAAAGPRDWTREVKFALWVFTLIGVLFSLYLTFLEPFVIGASCLWCLLSSAIITLLFILASMERRAHQEPQDRSQVLEKYA